MFCLLLFFVFNICVCVQSDGSNYSYNTTIVVPSSAKSSECYGEKKMFVVKKNEPFNITFLNMIGVSSKAPQCCNNANLNPCSKLQPFRCTYINTESVYGDKSTIITVSRDTEHIGSPWICTFEKTDNYPLHIYFVITVRDIEVIIGGEKTKPTEVPDLTQYHYIYNKRYNDGELIDLDCKGSSDGKIRLRYLDSNGTKLIETYQIEAKKSKLNFRKVMKTANNGDMIECEYTKEDTIFSERTIFSVKNDSTTRYYKILINDQTLQPINGDKNEEKSLYHYKYFKGDVLNITCEKNESIGRLRFGKDNNDDLKSQIEEDEINKLWYKTIKLTTESIDEKQLKCENAQTNYEADIKFHLDDRELLIKGLPTKNIINEYNRDAKTWIIEYQYTIGETVNLECIAKDEDEKVKFEGESTEAKERIITQQFVLRDDHNGRSITCTTEDGDDSQRVIVELHETVKYLASTKKDTSIEFKDFIIPAACLLVVTIIGVMAACFYCWLKKTKLLRAEQNRYANLQEPDLPIPPYPGQWNNRLQKKTNSEEEMTNNVLYNSATPVYANSQTRKPEKNINYKNINKNKPISNVVAELNKKTQIMVDNSMYNVNNVPSYSIPLKNKPNDVINNAEVAEYHYIEANAIFNLKDDKRKNVSKDTAPGCSNMETNDGVIYVEPYASYVHRNTESNGSNQAQPSNSKDVYDYVYAGRYANKMECGVNFNEGTLPH